MTRLAELISIQLQSESSDPEAFSDAVGKSSEEIVCLVKEYIQKNYASQINLSLLAEQFGFSQPYLTKIFSKHTGSTPAKYIKEYRISVAKQLLKTTDLPVFSISKKSGFTDQFYFCKTFKTLVGVTPSQYRTDPASREGRDEKPL